MCPMMVGIFFIPPKYLEIGRKKSGSSVGDSTTNSGGYGAVASAPALPTPEAGAGAGPGVTGSGVASELGDEEEEERQQEVGCLGGIPGDLGHPHTLTHVHIHKIHTLCLRYHRRLAVGGWHNAMFRVCGASARPQACSCSVPLPLPPVPPPCQVCDVVAAAAATAAVCCSGILLVSLQLMLLQLLLRFGSRCCADPTSSSFLPALLRLL